MNTKINPLHVRKVMGTTEWLAPEPFGPTGWKLLHRNGDASVLVSQSPAPASMSDLTEWIHASMARPDAVPSYEDLCQLKAAVWGPTGHAYQCFVPTGEHVNIHSFALHLWGRADGTRVLPDFGILGSI